MAEMLSQTQIDDLLNKMKITPIDEMLTSISEDMFICIKCHHKMHVEIPQNMEVTELFIGKCVAGSSHRLRSISSLRRR